MSLVVIIPTVGWWVLVPFVDPVIVISFVPIFDTVFIIGPTVRVEPPGLL